MTIVAVFDCLRRAGIAAALLCATAAMAQTQISPAEERLFTDEHLTNVAERGVLRYAYAKAGSMEPRHDDRVEISVSPSPTGNGRAVHVEYLSGKAQFQLPDITGATSNPVILFFLEHDVRDMQRRTGGQAAYFRKRVRMALAEAAEVQQVDLEYGGQVVPATQITIRPFAQDPLRARMKQLGDKVYVFTLADAVPGNVYRLQTRVGPQEGQSGQPLLEQTVTFTGAEP